MGEVEKPNQGSGCSEHHVDYLKKAAEACEAGDLVLGMHLYLAAYEKAATDPTIPDGMALAGLQEAWHLACDLKERSMAEYVFEKLEPYLTPAEIAEYAGELQDLALDRLEQIGFSREELQGMAEMIAQDLGADVSSASVVKVESVSIPHAEMFGVPGVPVEEVQVTVSVDDAEAEAEPDDSPEAAVEPADREAANEKSDRNKGLGMGVAPADDFNPYDMYRDYSIGKSWHAATVEGSGAEIFTRDEERAEAHEKFLKGEAASKDAAGNEVDHAEASNKDGAAAEADSASSAGEGAAGSQQVSGSIVRKRPDAPSAPVKAKADVPATAGAVPAVRKGSFSYDGLAGYDEAIAIMRDFGIGLQADRGYLDFVSMLNEQHGLDRSPALDTMLFRSPAIEDAARFAEATIGELGLPVLRMSIEENVQGMPVLCVSTQGNNRPRMNHAHNRFEAPAILVIEDLDMWTTPSIPEGVEGGINAFMMANLSRGAREAVGLIRSAVEDPDVYVLATATTSGEVDPFYYDVLEPMTVIDIGFPNEKERADIWADIAREHPSLRSVDREGLVRYSANIPRYDIYMAAREAVEEAYKLGLVQRNYVAVSEQNLFEKLAACQPLDSDAYREIEDEVVRSFREDLERLDDFLDGSRD